MVIAKLRFRFPFRLQIVLLVVVTLLPGLSLTIGQAFERRHADIAEARAGLQDAASAVAEQHDRYLREVERLMLTLAGTALLDRPREICADQLRATAVQMPRLWSVVVADPNGAIVCASRESAVGVNVADRSYFRAAAAQQGFVVGAAVVTRGQGRAVLPAAQALRDGGGTLRGVLVASIPVSWLADNLRTLRVEPGADLEIRDAAGDVLANAVGERAAAAELSPAAGGEAPRRFTATAFTVGRGLEVRLTLDQDVLEGPAQARWSRQMLLIAAAAALAVGLGNLYGRFTIARRAENLTAFAKRLQRGEREAPAPRQGPHDELSDLAAAFDRLALAVDERLEGVSREVESWRHRAEHDALTGLANRRALDARLRDELAAGAGQAARACLLLIDLDRFKDVNDRLGHVAGDAVLVAAARRMRAVVRAVDLVARRGGDEFAIVLASAPDKPVQPLVFAERLITVLSRPYRVAGRDAHLGASVGIAVCPAEAVDLELLYDAADRALYRAKAAGRGVARLGRVAAPPVEAAAETASAEFGLRAGTLGAG